MEDDSDPQNEATKGRLRSEDRRGQIANDYLDSDQQPQNQAPHDPEKDWEEIQSRRRNHRIMISLALIIPFGAASLFALSLFHQGKDHSENRRSTLTPPPPESFIEKATPTEIQQAIEKCLSGFMNARSNAERCRFIIGGSHFQDSLDEYYNRPGIHPPQNFGRILENNTAAFGGVTMHAVLALEAEESSGWVFNLLPTQTEMKIDWASSVGYGEQSWKRFQETKPREPTTMRVYLARAGGGQQTADPQKFGFCKIYTRGDEQSLPGFFQIDTKMARTLKKIVPPGGRQPVTVTVRWNHEGTAVEIIKISHNFWIDLAQYQKSYGKNGQ